MIPKSTTVPEASSSLYWDATFWSKTKLGVGLFVWTTSSTMLHSSNMFSKPLGTYSALAAQLLMSSVIFFTNWGRKSLTSVPNRLVRGVPQLLWDIVFFGI